MVGFELFYEGHVEDISADLDYFLLGVQSHLQSVGDRGPSLPVV